MKMLGRIDEKTSSLVEPFRTQEDIMKMQNYFLDNEKYLIFLIFEIGISMGRRIGDILELEWKHFYFPNGRKRRKLDTIKEQKTDKYSSPFLSESVWKAIDIYKEKTGCNPADNNYGNKISLQLSGTHAGKCITKDGCLKALKAASCSVGIDYNVGNHSLRKTFGYMTFNMFPNDPYKMQILQKIFNHSDSNVTLNYIGMTDDHAAKFYDGIGEMLCAIMNGETISLIHKATNIISCDYDAVSKIISDAVLWGRNNPNSTTEDILNYIEDCKNILREISLI